MEVEPLNAPSAKGSRRMELPAPPPSSEPAPPPPKPAALVSYLGLYTPPPSPPRISNSGLGYIAAGMPNWALAGETPDTSPARPPTDESPAWAKGKAIFKIFNGMCAN